MATINGTSGNDTLNGTSGDDTINGYDGDDTINGWEGRDRIYGDGGNDTIYGGDGEDFLYGGDGDDVIYGGAGGYFGLGDHIYDGPGNDTVYGGSDQDTIYASPGNDYYDGGTGGTYGWDLDLVDYSSALAGIVVDLRGSTNHVASSGVGDPAGIGTDTLVNIEMIVGSEFDDVMIAGSVGIDFLGAGGNDSLTGGAGNDLLEGGEGDDILDGGAGLDWASYQRSPVGVIVSLAIGGPQNTGQGVDTLTNIENLVGSGFDDTLTGNGGGNHIRGGGGNDTITGGAGNDLLEGGDGTDTFLFSAGDGQDVITDLLPGDVVRISGYTSAQSIIQDGSKVVVVFSTGDQITFWNTDVATVEAALQFAEANTINGTEDDDTLNGTSGGDTINGLGGNDIIDGGAGNDTLYGGGGNDLLAGGHDDDQLFGDDGDDRLYGEDGNDTLDGGAGADRLNGGAGDDSYWIDSADEVIEYSGAGSDTVYSSISYVLGANLETLRLTGSAAINATGNAADNLLVGNSGNNVLNGGAGADTMWGGAGNDSYWVDDAGDRISERAGEGSDIVYSSVSYLLGDNLETLRLTGSGSINGYGNGLDNLVVGTSGANVLGGGAGNDRLWGGGGDDRLYGEDGNDSLNGGAGADQMYGGTGNDSYWVDNSGDQVIEYSGSGNDTVYSSISYVLGDNLETLRLLGTGSIDATGNAANNLLVGNSGNNILDGGAGDDRLWGAGGDDTLIGGTGRDVYAGGSGSDRFVFADGDFGGATTAAADVIQDFAQAEGDLIDLSGVDANSVLSGDQAFAFIGTAAFSGAAGELRYEQLDGNTYVMGDTNGDGIADFMVLLNGTHTLTSGDFVI